MTTPTKASKIKTFNQPTDTQMDEIITDWIRAAVEGKTTDGRKVTKTELEQMASSYNPETYQAKLWLEHLRGTMPDSLFKSLGVVKQIKTELITTGDLTGKTAMYVKLSPAPELIQMVRNGQKTHLSAEIHPNFPLTGGAYLMGLGVTDSPASLGTGIMKFSQNQRSTHLFSELTVCEFGECQTLTPPQNTANFASKTDMEKLQNDFKKLAQDFEKLSNQVTEWGNQEIEIDAPAGEHTGGYYREHINY